MPSAVSPKFNSYVFPRSIFAQYQIRFLGCKGIVSVDSRLEGIQMCVRPSMNKFDVPWEDYGSIEIADTFGRFNIPKLNRFAPVFAYLHGGTQYLGYMIDRWW